MITFKKSIKFSILIAMMLILTQSVVLAGGGGPEPGSACSFDGKYQPPPYIGTITATIDAGGETYSINGNLDQVGNSECTAEISLPDLAIDLDIFFFLSGKDLKGICLQNGAGITITGPADCPQFTFYETVGVGNLKYNSDDTSFTAHYVVMGLD